MKIGAFAKKFDMNPSAIRFYIDKALLTPKFERNQYIFDESCIRQMERIIAYKHCGLSLEDIGTLLYYESAAKLSDPAIHSEAVRILSGRAKELRGEISEKKQTLSSINQLLKELDLQEGDKAKPPTRHIPIDGVRLLCCPKCKQQLAINGAKITGSGISAGELTCSCGYHAVIDNGIIICEGSSGDSPLKAFENIDSIVASTDDFSNAYRTLFEKGQLWMYQQICAKAQDRRCFLAGPFMWNFLLRYAEALPQDALYVIVDPSIKNSEKCRNISQTQIAILS